MSAKTNALRLLDEADVPYEVRPYDLSDDEFSAEAAAAEIGLPADQVFKTLVAEGTAGRVFAVIPAGAALDLKALAGVMGERKMATTPLADVLSLTGYPRGAVTVLGAKRSFPVVMDEMALVHEHIAVSAGAKGLLVLVKAKGYRDLTEAMVADIAR